MGRLSTTDIILIGAFVLAAGAALIGAAIGLISFLGHEGARYVAVRARNAAAERQRKRAQERPRVTHDALDDPDQEAYDADFWDIVDHTVGKRARAPRHAAPRRDAEDGSTFPSSVPAR